MDISILFERTLKGVLLRSFAVTGAVFSLAIPTTAVAQEGATLEEIIVVAQKREESLQDVPLSISALSEQDIVNRGINNVKDLTSSAPGIFGFESPSTRGSVGLNIRGVGGGNPNSLSTDPAAAVYVDGVYMGRSVGLGVDSGDIARLEILRGPQGTLFGRNSTGGAVNIITRKPADESGANLKLSAGNHGFLAYRFRVDTGASSDGVRTSFTARGRVRDDLYPNTNPDSTEGANGFENIDREGYRLNFSYDGGGDFTAEYVYDRSEIDNERTHALTVEGFTPTARAVMALNADERRMVDVNSPTRRATIMGLSALVQSMTPADTTAPADARTAALHTQFAQWAGDWVKWYDDTVATKPTGDARSADTRHTSSNLVNGQSLTLAWTGTNKFLGDFEVKSITGHRTVKNQNFADIDGQDNTIRPLMAGSPVTTGVISDATLGAIGALLMDRLNPSPFFPAEIERAVAGSLIDAIIARGRAETFNTGIRHKYRQTTQELQLVGSTNRLDYAGGLFFFGDEGDRAGQALSLFPIAFSMSNAYKSSSTSAAVYGQATFRLSDKLALTGGLRYTSETKNITYLYRTLEGPTGFVGYHFAGDVTAAYADIESDITRTLREHPVAFNKSYSRKFSNLSGKVAATYEFTDNFNVYASYSTGYRSGFYNGESFLTEDDAPDVVDEETIESIEVGAKSELFGRRLRLNGAFFNYKYKDIQVSTLGVAANGSIISRISNSGDAERMGVELEAAYLITDGLTVTLNVATIDGDFDSYPAVLAQDDTVNGGAQQRVAVAEQATTALVPDLQLNWNVDWVIGRFNFGTLSLNANGTIQGETVPIAVATAVYDTNNNRTGDTPVVFQNTPNEKRNIVNMRFSLNKVQLGGGELDIGVWATNLLDEKYRHFSFNYGAVLGASVSQAGEPRLIGVDLNYSF